MAKYLTRQRRQLLEYLSKHTDEQMTARQIAEALETNQISLSPFTATSPFWRKRDC